ncbi:hypothetical protein DUNSADRAFT_5793 [Dunaliella salina]|uniref:Uncharacterized protein n=1 Tax=Dunaliella salina TaxID=3046 RepID=A0ABQ7GPS3_DUNSA|nr:hypothetical protein DUNSADRAFT_5793 [Dunaliella salina]|eukprot:KAF5836556.1 hypothetical protein DUNSADRAFT_5793 [Dunaliella salina]
MSSRYTSSTAGDSSEEELDDDSLDDVPLFLSSSDAPGQLSNRHGSSTLPTSSSAAASGGRAIPSLGLPRDGSTTERPALGRLQLGALAKSTSDDQTSARPHRHRDSTIPEQCEQLSACTTSRRRGSDDHPITSDACKSSLPHEDPQHSAPLSRHRASIPSLSLGGLRASSDAQGANSLQPETPVNNGKLGPSQSVAVSLLSYAFVTSTPSQPLEDPSTSGNDSSSSIPSLHDSIAQRISGQLGVRKQDLRLFELKEIGSSSCNGQQQQQQQQAEQPQHHIGALVSNSGFSLAALEEMLAWNQQLQTMQSTHANTISTMHQDFKEATSDNKRLALECAAKDVELERLQERSRVADAEAEAMRLALQQGEEQRQQLVSVISMLKQEFLSLRSVIGGEAEQR